MSSTTRELISSLLGAGVPIREIARRLELAPTTVSYHVRRLREPAQDDDGRPKVDASAETDEADGARSTVRTRALVAELLNEGVRRAEIATRLGVSRGTVTYHARRLGADVDERCARRYDWAAVQRFHDDGHSVRACMARFGFSSASWWAAAERGALTPRPVALSIEELCVDGVDRGRLHIKSRLLREGLKTDRCETCGLHQWCGQPITLALHHVNGRRTDNRLQNLQLLCPNCHSQTDNFAGRGRAAAKAVTP